MQGDDSTIKGGFNKYVDCHGRLIGFLILPGLFWWAVFFGWLGADDQVIFFLGGKWTIRF